MKILRCGLDLCGKTTIHKIRVGNPLMQCHKETLTCITNYNDSKLNNVTLVSSKSNRPFWKNIEPGPSASFAWYFVK